MKKKKVIIVVSVVVVALVGAFVAYKMLAPKEPVSLPVTSGTVNISEIEQVVSIKGVVKGSDLAEISSNTTLEVTAVMVKEGDKVTKGQVLARLDGTSIAADYNKAVNTLEQSKYQYEASKTLYAEGAISMDELKKSQLAFENDTLSLSTFDKMDQTLVKSPITGTVTRINTSIGRAANDTKDKAPMFVIEDLENLQMNVKISEYDISKIQIGQTVEITAEVLGDVTATGVVSKISPTGEAKDMNSKEMVVPVTINVDSSGANLIAGVSARAKILIKRNEAALVVPMEAVLIDPDTNENSILKINDGVLAKVIVQLGIEGNLDVEIISDELKEGDAVVLSPTFDMTDGLKVTSTPQK